MRLAQIDVPFSDRYNLVNSDETFLVEAFPEPEINKFPFVNYRRGDQILSADDEKSDSGASQIIERSSARKTLGNRKKN